MISRSFPEGKVHWQFSYPFTVFKKIVITPDEQNFVCYGGENLKPTLYVHSAKNGNNLYTIPVKYNGFKEVLKIVALPDKPSVVALIDVDKGNQMDIIQQKHIRSISGWDGTCSKVYNYLIFFLVQIFDPQDGRYGLFAPSTGGMEMLDLRTGRVCKTLIPKIAEGIFDVLAVFNATNEYILYYHSGRKTIRAFRRKDGQMIANFRVQADLKGMETTTDGRCKTILSIHFINVKILGPWSSAWGTEV